MPERTDIKPLSDEEETLKRRAMGTKPPQASPEDHHRNLLWRENVGRFSRWRRLLDSCERWPRTVCSNCTRCRSNRPLRTIECGHCNVGDSWLRQMRSVSALVVQQNKASPAVVRGTPAPGRSAQEDEVRALSSTLGRLMVRVKDVSTRDDSERTGSAPESLQAIVEQVASALIHRLAPSFRPLARIVCPSDEAEQAIVHAVVAAAAARGIPVEVIDVRPAPAARLDDVTARLVTSVDESADGESVPTLLILLGFDVFGDDAHDGPTYPFRSRFQFDKQFLWLFVGQETSRMRFLFGSHQRPLYRAAGDITPEDWRATQQHGQLSI